jgi:hypothetical protein
MALWEQILLGVLVVLVLLWFRPGVREALRQSREAKDRDWAGVLLPIGLVILFVVLLIALLRG